MLTSELLFNDKIINVKSTEGFLDKGLVYIENETIYYNKKSSTRFDEVTRNLFGSSKKLLFSL